MKGKETLLEELRAMNFALVDLKLYLDTHPCECQKIQAYNQFVEKYRELMTEYQETYGPMIAEDHLSGCPWQWVENPWPWDGVCGKNGG